jgi:glycosyltransferase involved in cell wall biosynthesis
VRILHVIQVFDVGGAELLVVSLARGAREAGHEVGVAAAPGPLAGELGVEPYPLPVLERRKHLVPKGAIQLRRAIREFRPDLVHAHNPAMAAITTLATMRGRRPRALVTVHGVPDADYPAAARVLRLGGLPVVACGDAVASALRDERVDVAATIPNAVPPAPPPAERRAIADELGIPEAAPLVVTVGRLAPVKNQTLAIRALAEVPDARLLVVGDGPLRGDLEQAAADSGIAERVTFAGTRSDARALIGAADVAVISSEGEGLPLVALEALAGETPLVATAGRGLRELLTDGKTARLVPPGEEQALALAISEVLEDPDLRRRLVAGGRALAAEHDEVEMVASYLAISERIAAGGLDG